MRRVERVERGHDALLFGLIGDALAEAGARYADIDRIVCCTGPGSFAGVRVGVAAARGLALGTGAPAVGITRLEALAAEAAGQARHGLGVVLAGRGDTVFLQRFAPDGTAQDEPRAISAKPAEPDLLNGIDLLAGDGAPAWRDLPRCLVDGLPDPAVLARLGAAREGAPAPLYLRPPAADLPREAPPRVLD